MTAEEYFYNHWQKANTSRFCDYGDYDSDEYAIAFANDYAAFALHDVVGQSEQLVCDCPSELFAKYYTGDGKCGYCGGKAES